MERNFTTSPFKGFRAAINNKQIVMTDIPTNDPNIYHNVAVVGYHPDGTLIYMDPEEGYLRQAPENQFGVSYKYSIISCL